ncbi:hypothetical protein MXB_254 [Myxobolus squamalis]|nr:hypothetical protein MXB_254 [Myxobolus squamalis]
MIVTTYRLIGSTEAGKNKQVSGSQLACALAIGGTIFSFCKLNNSCNFTQILQNKSSHLVFPNVFSLLTCENFIVKFKDLLPFKPYPFQKFPQHLIQIIY